MSAAVWRRTFRRSIQPQAASRIDELPLEQHVVQALLNHAGATGDILRSVTSYEQGEFLAPSRVDQEIFRRCMQDESRHVGFGTMHLRAQLKANPAVAEELHEQLDDAEDGAAVPDGERHRRRQS